MGLNIAKYHDDRRHHLRTQINKTEDPKLKKAMQDILDRIPEFRYHY